MGVCGVRDMIYQIRLIPRKGIDLGCIEPLTRRITSITHLDRLK